MEFQPKYKDFKKKVDDSFSRQQFMTLLNAKLIDVQPGFVKYKFRMIRN